MKKIISILLLAIVCYACSTSKPKVDNVPENKSHYQIQKYKKNQPGDSVIVTVGAKRIEGDILTSFILKVNENDIHEFRADTAAILSLTPGFYTFEFLEEFSYRTKTREITLRAKDSVRINFYSELNPIDN